MQQYCRKEIGVTVYNNCIPLECDTKEKTNVIQECILSVTYKT